MEGMEGKRYLNAYHVVLGAVEMLENREGMTESGKARFMMNVVCSLLGELGERTVFIDERKIDQAMISLRDEFFSAIPSGQMSYNELLALVNSHRKKAKSK